MAGRKRKPGVREPNGQLSRKDAESSYSPTAVKRLTATAIAKASDPRLGSEIGRLLLAGELTARQAAAGWRFAEVRSEYLTAINAPRLKTARLERGQRGEPPEDGTAAAEAIERSLVKAAKRNERAQAVLSGCGSQAARAVELLTADVNLLTYEQLRDAREGLNALAAHFGGEAR